VKHTPFRVSVFVLITTFSSALAAAQTSAPAPPAAPAARDTTTASEDFDLNIAERRITESDFEASTEVSAVGEGPGRGLALRVGVMVRAGNIDVLLRNVQGRVRFRASLEPVLRLLNLRRAEPTAAPPPATPNPSP
jgi:hypothetical protein